MTHFERSVLWHSVALAFLGMATRRAESDQWFAVVAAIFGSGWFLAGIREIVLYWTKDQS